MKPLSLNLSKMRKIAGDANSSTFMHPSGHQMVIAHHAVSALQRKQLEKMPVQNLADGGDAIAHAPSNIYTQPLPDDLINPNPGSNGGNIGGVEKTYPMMGDVVPSESDDQKFLQDQDRSIAGSPTSAAQMVPDVAPAPPAAAMPAQKSHSMDGGFEQSYQGAIKAEREQQDVSSKQAQSSADLEKKDIADREALNQTFNQASQVFQSQQGQFMKDYAAGKIDPKHYQENMSTGSKIATGIGLLLGGVASATTGVNPAFEFLNKQIDRDIKSQEANLDKKKTLLGANQALYHDNVLALNQTRINMNDILAHKINLAASQLGTPQAKAIADAHIAQLGMQNAATRQQMALRAAAMQGANSGALDPARFVPFLVPKEHQAKAFGEIEAAENTRKMSGDILNAFEQAAKENTVMRTGAGMLRTPGSVYALHQAMQPTFKDLEGTVRQAAMDNTFKNITPMPGDMEKTIGVKRQALQSYLQSKLSAPTARGYGIDLQKFQSTAPAPIPQYKTVNGVRYMRGPHGEAVRVE